MLFETYWALFLLPVALLPLFWERSHRRTYSWLALLPQDKISDCAGLLLKTLAAIALLCIILGIAGPHSPAQHVEKIGRGAQIVLTIDRSASMDDVFSGSMLNGRAGESKAAAARRLITQFVKQRHNDMLGMVMFSNSAMYAMPLTQSREAMLAAVAATGGSSLLQTNIGSGLTMALSLFNTVPDSGSRAMVLLSDGAGRIDANTQQKIRDWLDRMHITLYWIVLRQPGTTSILDDSYVAPDDGPMDASVELHQFFKTLRSGYQPYEAEDPQSLALAMEDINRKEKKPIRYLEQIPGHNYTAHCFALAAFMVSLLLGIKLMEIKSW